MVTGLTTCCGFMCVRIVRTMGITAVCVDIRIVIFLIVFVYVLPFYYYDCCLMRVNVVTSVFSFYLYCVVLQERSHKYKC